jgi:ABC-type Mn2+/Zn2+ transport system ATPase subunit
VQDYLLKDVTCHIPEGSYIGVCGERGAGKTTIFKVRETEGRLRDGEGEKS